MGRLGRTTLMLAALVAAGGCGRIGFDRDERAPDAGAPGADGSPVGRGDAGGVADGGADGDADAGALVPSDAGGADSGAMGADAGEVVDAGALPPCADANLGSALGRVAEGSTAGMGDDHTSCGGGGSPDVAYAWTAPASATYRIDTCGSSLDTVLTVLPASCTDMALACDDDDCDGFSSMVNVDLTAGETVIIVVDGWMESGSYTLDITAL